jgi:MurNAc alpha-1-phosphate uridylyltransferase
MASARRNLRVMVLAAGRGERMRPLTDTVPKPLLAAGGRPLVVWHLERLAAAGFDDVVINHAWLGERIEAALGNGEALGLRIRYSAEGTALETAGGIARALPLLVAGNDDTPFVVVSADVFCNFDIGRARTIALQMAASRLTCWCLMVDNPAHHGGGDFRLDGGRLGLAADRMQAAAKPRAPTAMTYGGIGLFRPSLFREIAPGAKMPLRPILDSEIGAGRAGGEYHGGVWFDIGTPQRLAELNRMLESTTRWPALPTDWQTEGR